MISLNDQLKNILLGESLSQKLTKIEYTYWDSKDYFIKPETPGRSQKIRFSDIQKKFPKASNLNIDCNKAQALHTFANHELLAIEMMACTCLILPNDHIHEKFKKSIIYSLKDEQKHLSLYISRLNQLGYQFGDFPLNSFFWKFMKDIKEARNYIAIMALTFESANLDFASYYLNLFNTFEDYETANILQIVLNDELTHVNLGSHWFNQWHRDKSLWQYYLESLPWPLTPARSKGICYDENLRLSAGLCPSFVDKLTDYHDDFSITARRK